MRTTFCTHWRTRQERVARQARQKTAGCVFNDVVAGSSALPTGGTGKGTNSVPCTGRTLDCSSTVSGGIGVLDDPNNPGKLAWLTTAGYDLVTGLGSLNIGNLVTSWANVSSVADVNNADTLTNNGHCAWGGECNGDDWGDAEQRHGIRDGVADRKDGGRNHASERANLRWGQMEASQEQR